MENIGYFVSQNLLFCLSFILLLGVYVVFELIQTKKNQYDLNVTQAVMLVNKDKGVYLDTRDKEAYAKAHIIEAQNIAINELNDKYKKLVKYKSKPIIIYGEQPQKAMLFLRKEGYGKVYTLKGGLSEWMKASYPIKSIS